MGVREVEKQVHTYQYGRECGICGYHSPSPTKVRKHIKQEHQKKKPHVHIRRAEFPLCPQLFEAIKTVNDEARTCYSDERQAILYAIKKETLDRMLSEVEKLVRHQTRELRTVYALFFRCPETGNVWSFHLPDIDVSEEPPYRDTVEEFQNPVSFLSLSEALAYLQEEHAVDISDYEDETLVNLANLQS